MTERMPGVRSVALGVWVRTQLLRGRPWHTLTTAIAESVESPGTKAYTSQELESLFAAFDSVELVRFVTPYDRRVAGPLATLTGPRLGWFAGVVAS